MSEKEQLADGSTPGARNLEEDLATCNAATPGPWRACGPVRREDVVREEAPAWTDAPCGLTATVWEVGQVGDNYAPGLAVVNSNEKRTAEPNARFIAEAREGWPSAILSAMESQRVYRRLRQLVLHRHDIPEDVRQEVLRLCVVDDRDE